MTEQVTADETRQESLDSQELTVKEAAQELGYDENTVRAYITRGIIKIRKYGWSVRIPRDENRELFEQRRALLKASNPA